MIDPASLIPTVEAYRAEVLAQAEKTFGETLVQSPSLRELLVQLADIQRERMLEAAKELAPLFDECERIRERVELDKVTGSDLDRLAVLAFVPEFQRKTSNVETPETPLWNSMWGWWEETDEQFRTRIRGGT